MVKDIFAAFSLAATPDRIDSYDLWTDQANIQKQRSKMNTTLKGLRPVILLFIVLNGFFIGGKNMLIRWGADHEVLIIGNAILFLITIVSFILAQKGLNNPNSYAFVRAVYGGIMIKLFLCLAAAFIYISTNKAKLNKPALFICMGLYLVYTFMEVSALMKLLRGKKNA
jgi:hypothetical protein